MGVSVILMEYHDRRIHVPLVSFLRRRESFVGRGAEKTKRKGSIFLAKGYPPEWGQQISACFKKR